MSREEFKNNLKNKLTQLPNEEIEKSISYFDEMIDDRMEDGMKEEDAVKEMGNIDDIAEKILTEMSLYKLVKTRVKPEKDYTVLEIILLVLGFPVWFPLIISFFAVIGSICISIFSVIFSLYVTVISIFAAGVLGLIFSPVAFVDNFYAGLFIVASSLICIGLSIFLLYATNFITKWIIKGMGYMWKKIKKLFIKKEARV